MPLIQGTSLQEVKGILFDLDGTLYHQLPLRIVMAFLLVTAHLSSPMGLVKKIRIIRAYRKAQETLRQKGEKIHDLGRTQIALASEETGEPLDLVAITVKDWFDLKPLPFLKIFKRRGLHSFLQAAQKAGLNMGVFSDYPAEEKLKALGIRHFLSVVLSGSDPEVRGFKPMTNGFRIAARRMGLTPGEVLYIGDRPEVDAIGAMASGMQSVILKRFGTKTGDSSHMVVNSLAQCTPFLFL